MSSSKTANPGRTCRSCGCTDNDCSGCIERTGRPCFWVDADLCSASVGTSEGLGCVTVILPGGTLPPTDTKNPNETKALPEGWTNAPIPPEHWAGSYPIPDHGWTCFFCGETFTTIDAARYHFGGDPFDDPACRIKDGQEKNLLLALRRAQDELARYHADDSEIIRQMHATETNYRTELQRAEELGYSRGLRDARSEQ